MEVDLLETLFKNTNPASELGQTVGANSQEAINVTGQRLPRVTGHTKY